MGPPRPRPQPSAGRASRRLAGRGLRVSKQLKSIHRRRLLRIATAAAANSVAESPAQSPSHLVGAEQRPRARLGRAAGPARGERVAAALSVLAVAAMAVVLVRFEPIIDGVPGFSAAPRGAPSPTPAVGEGPAEAGAALLRTAPASGSRRRIPRRRIPRRWGPRRWGPRRRIPRRRIPRCRILGVGRVAPALARTAIDEHRGSAGRRARDEAEPGRKGAASPSRPAAPGRRARRPQDAPLGHRARTRRARIRRARKRRARKRRAREDEQRVAADPAPSGEARMLFSEDLQRWVVGNDRRDRWLLMDEATGVFPYAGKEPARAEGAVVRKGIPAEAERRAEAAYAAGLSPGRGARVPLGGGPREFGRRLTRAALLPPSSRRRSRRSPRGAEVDLTLQGLPRRRRRGERRPRRPRDLPGRAADRGRRLRRRQGRRRGAQVQDGGDRRRGSPSPCPKAWDPTGASPS